MIKISSDKLYQFYKEYVEWVMYMRHDDVESHPFSPRYGLCTNLTVWCYGSDKYWLRAELTDQLADSGLCRYYPFGGEDVYNEETDKYTCHENNARLEWCQNRIDDYEAEHGGDDEI